MTPDQQNFLRSLLHSAINASLWAWIMRQPNKVLLAVFLGGGAIMMWWLG
jgi:hypothetical protein